jgi:hypothetical protein
MYSLTNIGKGPKVELVIHQDTYGESIIRKKYYGIYYNTNLTILLNVRIGSLFKNIILKLGYFVGCMGTFPFPLNNTRFGCS